MIKKLNARQLKALNAYMKGSTKKAALLEAGYSEKTSNTSQSQMFDNPAFQHALDRRQKLAAQRADVTLDWIVGRLKSIANANMADLLVDLEDGSVGVDLTKLTPDLKRALTQISVDEYVEGRGPGSVRVKKIKIAPADKLRALELLVRHLGLSKEKTVVTGTIDLVDRLNAGRIRAGTAETSEDDEVER